MRLLLEKYKDFVPDNIVRFVKGHKTNKAFIKSNNEQLINKIIRDLNKEKLDGREIIAIKIC